MRDPIARAGLDYHVGVAGSRLSPVQRRRVGLGRAKLKRRRGSTSDAADDLARPARGGIVSRLL